MAVIVRDYRDNSGLVFNAYFKLCSFKYVCAGRTLLLIFDIFSSVDSRVSGLPVLFSERCFQFSLRDDIDISSFNSLESFCYSIFKSFMADSGYVVEDDLNSYSEVTE